MLRIVMDGAGDMPPDWGSKYDIQVLPINIQFGGKSYLQGIELSDEDFYRLVDKSGVIPQTSQPSPQQFVDFYKKVANPGDVILSFHVTSKLSGTYESALIAAEELKSKYEIYPIDSLSGSAAMGYMGQEARLLEKSGASIQDIMKRMEFIRHNIVIILTLNTLEYARKSGRVKTLQAALASLLNVKPIVVLHEGVLDMADRVRTRGRALQTVLDMVKKQVGDKLVNAAVVHARDIEIGKTLMEMSQKSLNCHELIMTSLSVAVAANLGPGTVGIVAYVFNGG